MPEVTPKPGVGEIVFFHDPEITRRVGFGNGYGNRGAGPYAAIVVNDNRPADELDLFVMFPAHIAGFVHLAIKEKPDADEAERAGRTLKPYWDYRDAAQKARAVKNAKARDADQS